MIRKPSGDWQDSDDRSDFDPGGDARAHVIREGKFWYAYTVIKDCSLADQQAGRGWTADEAKLYAEQRLYERTERARPQAEPSQEEASYARVTAALNEERRARLYGADAGGSTQGNMQHVDYASHGDFRASMVRLFGR